MLTTGLLAGVLPSFGALTAWVWVGPDNSNDYYASGPLHEAAPEQSYLLALIISVLAILVITTVSIVHLIKRRRR